MGQDQNKDKQTKSTDQDQSEKKEAGTEAKTSSKAGQAAKAEQPPEQQEAKTSSKAEQAAKAEQPPEQQNGEPKEAANSLLQVLDFLKNSNLINLDMPLKSLFDQVQNIQADPSTEWGLIGDTGHWALVWQKKE